MANSPSRTASHRRLPTKASYAKLSLGEPSLNSRRTAHDEIVHSYSNRGVLRREISLAFGHPIRQTREMITVTEPQVWTMIGLMAAVFFGTMTLISTMFTRVVRSEIGGLRGEIGGLRGEIGGLKGEMNARFDAVNSRIDNLDRDVQFLMNREINRDN